MKVVSTKTKCATFDKLRFENDTRKKASFMNLLLASGSIKGPSRVSSIKGHLYCCFFNIQEQNSIFNKTGSHANSCKFFWGIDGDVTFRKDKMLLSMLKHYTLRFTTLYTTLEFCLFSVFSMKLKALLKYN